MALDGHFLNLAPVHGGDKFTEDDLRLAPVLFAEDVKKEQKNQHQDQPQGQIFRHLIQN
jgi:hypothetical protein